ncbi:MAG: UDP-forming cellulose synthase catalytic subunit [Cyanobacteria bacterium J06648_16]
MRMGTQVRSHLQDRWQRQLAPSITRWLTQTLPTWLEPVFRWLGKRELLVLLLAMLMLAMPLVMARPTILQQGLVALGLVAMGQFLLRLEEGQTNSRTSEYLHLLLVVLSGLTTLRYLYYRTSYTINFDSALDLTFSLLLYAAELYAIATLVLSYFQTLKIRERRAIPLDTWPQDQWPSVDIYIPTYNEDVDIVRKTVLGALNIDYPAPKKQVYILDDGRAPKYQARRRTLQAMCAELGCSLLTRDNNDHAKAGNINTALAKTQGELVLILDCDHIPVRGFLQETVGFFFNDNVALVQTPHWFYNPDPFERNLLTGGKIPVGNELFYKVLQKGNDFWNAAFFCGSAAVIRRPYLLEIGGIATETVTEDCHTSLRLHSLGYQTVYYDKIMVAGLAPEKFSAYVGQQVRWARGMAQILRLENPLFNPRLKLQLSQRLCYVSATSHFFFGFPRLMYAIAPNLFLLFGINPVQGLGLETLFYALPHIVLSMHTNHIPYKHVRFSFWNEIYEFAMSFQAGIVTLLALINPKLGSFNVTDKGLAVEDRNFDIDSVRYLVILGALTGASLLAVPVWLVLSPADTQAVLINALWCGFNLILVVTACLVAFEQPQVRRSHRLPRQLTAIIHDGDQQWTGTTLNVSETGGHIVLDEWPNISDRIQVELIGDYDARVLLSANVVRAIANDRLQTELAVDFIGLSQIQKDDLAVVLYSDVSRWYSQQRSEVDHPLKSLQFIFTSLRRVFKEFRPASGVQLRKRVNAVAELYWQGWGGHVQTATITEIGSQTMRLELFGETETAVQSLKGRQPVLIVRVYRSLHDPTPPNLLAQVERLELLPRLSPNRQPDDSRYRVSLEMTFLPVLAGEQNSQLQPLIDDLSKV